MHAKAVTVSPLVADQGLKRLQFLTMTNDKVLCYLKKQTPQTRNELVATI